MFVNTLSFTRSVTYKYSGKAVNLIGGSSFNRKSKQKDVVGLEKKKAKTRETFFECFREKKVKSLYDFKGISYTNDILRKFSRRSKDKVQNKIFAMYSASDKRFFFLTLTFVEFVPDQVGVKILNKFFTALRKKAQFSYIWVAEHQPQTKCIHFHVIIDKRFDVSYLNSLWVSQQYESGLRNETADAKLFKDYGKVEFNNDGSFDVKCKTFVALHKQNKFKDVHKYLNPLDVKNITSVDNLSMYLTNYITKNNDIYYSFCWHCSRSVSRLYTNTIVSAKVTKEVFDEKINKTKVVDKKTKKIKEYIPKTFVNDFSLIRSIYNKEYFRKYMSEIDLINRYILENLHEKYLPIIASNGDLFEINNIKYN